MIWICRVLCPKGHVMAAGASEAGIEDRPMLAQSFVNFLYETMPVITCEQGCYQIDLRSMNADLEVAVERTGFQTLKEAAAILAKEAAGFRMKDHLYQRRN